MDIYYCICILENCTSGQANFKDAFNKKKKGEFDRGTVGRTGR